VRRHALGFKAAGRWTAIAQYRDTPTGPNESLLG